MKLIAKPSPSTYIHHEEFVQLTSPLKIKSNVPVTIQRVNNLPSLAGAKIVVSSDCTFDETTFIPKVSIEGDSVAIEAKPSKGWLESVWFQAFWSTNDCERNLQTATDPPSKEELATIDSYCGLDWMDAYDKCQLACPTGDSDCVSLGVEYTCHQFTTCYGRIESGAFGGLEGESSTNDTLSGSTASPVEITSTILSGGLGEATADATQPARVSTGVASFSTESSTNVTFAGVIESTQSTTFSTVSLGNETMSTLSPETGATLGSVDGSVSVLPTADGSEISQTSIGSETFPSNTDGLNDTDVVTVTTSTESQTSVISNNQSSVISTTTNVADASVTTQAITTSSGATSPAEATSTATATESSDVTPGQTPTVRPYNYNYPSASPAGTFEPSTWTYTPTFLPTSDARGYGLVVTTFALGAILMVFGFDGKIAVAGVAVFASLPFIKTSANTIQSSGVENNQMCMYHVDVLISTCQTVHVDAPAVRLANADVGDGMMSSIEGGCNEEYSSSIVSQVEKLILEDDAKNTIETLC